MSFHSLRRIFRHSARQDPNQKLLKPCNDEWRRWGSSFGNGGSIGADDGDLASVSSNGVGLSGGVERRIGPGSVAGLTFGGADSKFNVQDRWTTGAGRGANAGVYTRIALDDGLYVQGILSAGWYNYETSRTAAGNQVEGNFDQYLIGGRAELGRKIAFAGGFISPFVTVQADHMVRPFYREKNVDQTILPFGLDFHSQRVDSLPLGIGAQIERKFVKADGTEITPLVRVAYSREFQSTRSSTVAFVAAPDFTWDQQGMNAPYGVTEINGRVTISSRNSTFLYLDLMSQISKEYQSLSGNIGVKVDF